jgi:adenylosuccinate synthase
MLTAITGINWGDEGKGRMVDLLSQSANIVVRYQGGNNAGHTVINPKGKFVLNLLPSGILRDDVVCVMGPGMVIDIGHLIKEIETLKDRGIDISPRNLKISNRATICLPLHVLLDALEEDRLGKNAQGSTRRGIAPTYADKYLRKALRMGDLCALDDADLQNAITDYINYKNLFIERVYGTKGQKPEGIMAYLKDCANKIGEYICDTGEYLTKAAANNENILFEAQLGALRDIDFGIYPYTSSSTTLASFAPCGAGVPQLKLDKSIGITKAYSSCVGGGPFVSEYFGDEAHELREAGGEYGAATGRPRRVGAFDVVASRYGCRMQGADEVALTMLDVLSYLDEISVCVAYNINGKIVDDFPYGMDLAHAKPVIEKLPGWKTDISEIRKKEDLPQNALNYIKFIEKSLNVPITMVSVGPKREAYIEMEN